MSLFDKRQESIGKAKQRILVSDGYRLEIVREDWWAL